MFNADEIRQITFEKVVRGYRPEDVESFMEKIADEFETLAMKNRKLKVSFIFLLKALKDIKQKKKQLKQL